MALVGSSLRVTSPCPRSASRRPVPLLVFDHPVAGEEACDQRSRPPWRGREFPGSRPARGGASVASATGPWSGSSFVP